MSKKLYIFDLDMTLADCQHRLHWILTKPKNWKAFYAGIPYDTPIFHNVEILKQYVYEGHHVVLCTGRSEDQRVRSEEWLFKHKIPYDSLWMRDSRDNSKDYICKPKLVEQIIEHYDMQPELIYDDKPEVIQAYRDIGWNVIAC